MFRINKKNLICCLSSGKTTTSHSSHHKNSLSKNENLLIKPETNQQIIFDKAVELFESRCQAISHFCCQNCQMAGINIKPSQKNADVCTMCNASYTYKENIRKNLPTWLNEEGVEQFELPEEL